MNKKYEAALNHIEQMLNLLCEALLDDEKPKCDHIYQWWIQILIERDGGVHEHAEKGTVCVYCPKCGEKL